MESFDKIIDVDPKIITRLECGYSRLSDNDDLLSNRYLSNIKVIERLFPNVYLELSDYQPKNKNVFIEADGALNIFFPDTGYTLFSEYPFEQIEDRYQEFCASPSRTRINLQTGISDRCRHEYYLTRINSLRQKSHKASTPDEKFPDIVGGVVLFGFDLGYQLVRMLDDKKPRHIYIYEENLDMFYYSLFAIDWEWIESVMLEKDCTIHLFLGVDEKTFIDQYLIALRYNGMYMAAHTYVYAGYGYEHVKKVIDEFELQFARQVMGWGFFDDGLRGIGQYLGRTNKTYLAVSPLKKIRKGFDKKLDMPVFILGNGPSLDNVIDVLNENKDNCIIVSSGSTINTLSKLGIKPDYHVDLERLKYTAEKLEYLDKEFLSGITALTVNVMHPEFYEYFDRALIALKPSEPISSIMKRSELISSSNRSRLLSLNYCGPIVANLSLAYFVEMGFSNIYLAGVDCGFKDPENHHSKSSPYYFDDGSSTGLAKYSNLLQRNANFEGKVYTNELMDASRIQLELAISKAKSENSLFHCYNLSDGVEIRGADSLRAEECLLQGRDLSFKEHIKDYIWDNYASYEYDSDGKNIDGVFDSFLEMVDEFYELINSPFEKKEDVLLALAKMNSILMVQLFKVESYNCELMFGTFVYFANEIVTVLFYSKDVDFDVLKGMTGLFSDFLKEMPDMVANPLSEIDKGTQALVGKYNA